MLFVCINEQLEDALAVLKDPNHEVANPVDVAEFERRAETDGLGTILRGSAAILGVLICIVGVLLVLHLVG